jgi:hypothetical protein
VCVAAKGTVEVVRETSQFAILVQRAKQRALPFYEEAQLTMHGREKVEAAVPPI